jgi:hypothetical protein
MKMAIKVKNPFLYSKWIDYLTWKAGLQNSNASVRTEAFFNSMNGIQIPG